MYFKNVGLAVVFIFSMIKPFNAQWDDCKKDKKTTCGGIYCESGEERCDKQDPRYDCKNLLPALQEVQCHSEINCDPKMYWCQERGECIKDTEVCDCGPHKIQCTSDTYFCADRKGILNNPNYMICPDSDASCKKTCINQARIGQFSCGNKFKNKTDITKFRCCKGEWINSGDYCFKSDDQSPLPSLDPNSSTSPPWWVWILVAIVLAIISIGAIIGCVIFIRRRNSNQTTDPGIALGRMPSTSSDNKVENTTPLLPPKAPNTDNNRSSPVVSPKLRDVINAANNDTLRELQRGLSTPEKENRNGTVGHEESDSHV